MGMRHGGAAAFAAGVIGLIACSGGGIESSCGNYFDKVVSLESQCGSDFALDPSLKSNFEKYCDGLAAEPGAKDLASQIDTCASTVSAAGCNGSAINCRITGSLPDGSACGNGTQCTGGLCDTSGTQPSTTTELNCGKCASYLQVGADCTAPSATCDPSTSECRNGKCTALATQGQSCATIGCANGLTCDTGTQTCVTPPTQGQACTTTCASPYRCINSTCTTGVQQGGACPVGDECAPTLSCDMTTHTCQPQQRATEGQPCGFVNNAIVGCQSGLQCTESTPNTFTCQTPKNLGETCTVGKQECQIFLACVNGTCQQPDYSTCK